MPYRLGDRVSFCVAGGQIVFLDAQRDRYFCVRGPAALAFQALLDQEPACPEGLDKLTTAGLVEFGEAGPAIQPISTSLPSRSLTEDSSVASPIQASAVLEAAWALTKIRARLKRRPFALVLDGLRAQRPRNETSEAGSAIARLSVAASFNAARRLVPIKPVCLLDSLALLDCLARRHLFADLVFGVKTHPFAAHCWVQADDIVLNDAIDHVAPYTPILVVG